MSMATQSVRPGLSPRTLHILRVVRLPVAIVVVLAIFGWFEPRVLSGENLANVAVQTSYLAIFATAQCMVILTRGFDLSLGYTVSLVSVVASLVMVASGEGAGAILLGVLAGLGVGLVVGLANGLLIGGVELNPLVTTLGMSYVVLAFASTVSDGFPVSGLPPALNALFSQGTFLGLAVPIWLALAVLALMGFVLHLTRLGRSLYIVGSNPRAAVAAGIRTLPTLVLAYIICSGLAAIGALLLTARTGSGEPNLGGNLTLESIAAAVVGGVRLTGGEGGVSSALLGALFVTVLSNGMNLVQVDGYLQQIGLGAIIILSLIVSRSSATR